MVESVIFVVWGGLCMDIRGILTVCEVSSEVVQTGTGFM